MTRLLAILAMLWAGSALAQEEREVPVRFAPGATSATINDRITGYESVLYKIGAEAGQRMTLRLEPSNLATYFNLYAPGTGPGDQALASGQFTGENSPDLNVFDGTLPTSGVYSVSVFMMRAAARRNEVSDYALTIGITGALGDRVEADYADGLQGGPDFWAVATSGGPLNMRSGPSAGSAVAGQLANGQTVRNLGCRMAEGRRWCNVATLADPGVVGWAAGDFLVETGAPSATAAPSAGDQSFETTVRFAPGTSGATIPGTLAPGQSHRYVLGAANGQDLRVTLMGPGLDYQILNPDRSFLLDMVPASTPYTGQLWQSGDHVIEVINRTGGMATYELVVAID